MPKQRMPSPFNLDEIGGCDECKTARKENSRISGSLGG